MVIYGSIVFTLQFLFFTVTPLPLLNQDRCTWEGRGYPKHDRSISLIHLNCKENFIRWKKPHGGKRIIFQPVGIKDDFKVCFTSRFKGVNIYKDNGNKLILLQDYRKSSLTPICFDSYRKNAVLFIENEERKNDNCEIKFTVHVKGKDSKLKYTDECKPCNEDQIKESLCKSDFVVHGYIKNYVTLTDGLSAQANISAKDIITQRKRIFTKDKSTDRYSMGSVKVPSTCSWLTWNAHLHIFTGLVIPGKGPVLTCRIKKRKWMQYRKHDCLKEI